MVQTLTINIPNLNNLPTAPPSPLLSPMDTASISSDSTLTLSIASTIIASQFAEIPLTALSRNSRRQLSQLLNARKILRSEEGYERDWRGIAVLAQQKNLCDENALSAEDAMTKVLHLWCTNNPKTATFANLERFLGIIDRWDVCDDIYENLVEDAKTYKITEQQKSSNLALSNDETEASAQAACSVSHIDDFSLGSDPNILTKDDVQRAQKGLPPQLYDAFLLFADADINYAVEMLTKLEDNPEYNFKLCIKDRDLLAGVSFAHVALTQLIEERCKHLIVILTAEFMKSPENKFLVNYTQALQIENKTRKIIPLLYEDSVAVPRTLKIYTHLKYTENGNGLFNFWTKLAASLRNVQYTALKCTTIPTPPIYTKNLCSTPVLRRQEYAAKHATITKLPTPPTEIPSISINGESFVCDDLPMPQCDMSKRKNERQKLKLRPNTLLYRRNGEAPMAMGGLRNAHSTSQLNGKDYQDTNVSLSNLSTTSSVYSDTATKKKRKWPGKLFKKVFSRSSSKLQEPA